MIIEFLGVPGIGKSYVVKRFSKLLDNNGYKSKLTNEKYYRIKNKQIWRARKVCSVIKLLSLNTKAWKILILLIKDHSPLKVRLSNVYNVLSVIAANKSKDSENLIVLRDEGIYQVLFSLKLFSRVDIKKILNLIKQIIETPNIVVYLYSKKSVMDGLNTQDKGGRIYRSLINGNLSEHNIKSSIEFTLSLSELKSINVREFEYNKSEEHLTKLIRSLTNELSVTL